jgi:phosphoglycerate dehydrogenase-like enzyme
VTPSPLRRDDGSPTRRPKSNLLAKIAAKEATVGVIGLGYVGLPLALVFEEAGFPVIGFVTGGAGSRMRFEAMR